VQDPAVHWSLQVAALPSSQAVPLGWNPFAGQLALVPVQASATSQAPAAARHTVPTGCKLLAGQYALVPVQLSATSQTPAAARQTVVLALKVLTGQ